MYVCPLRLEISSHTIKGANVRAGDRKLRILFASSWTFPHVGGVNTFIQQLKHGLEQAQHQVDLFCPTPDGQGYYVYGTDEYILREPLALPIAEKVRRYFDLHAPNIDPWIVTAEVERYCYEAAAAYLGLERYDLIHTQDVISTHAMARVKPSNKPLVSTIHGCLAMEWFVNLQENQQTAPDENSILWKYSEMREHVGVTASDVTLVPSQWLKRIFVDRFAVPEEQLLISPYGMDNEQFFAELHKSAHEDIPNDDRQVIICPARLDVVKGHIHLLHALASLKEERQNWVCWIVGYGQLEAELKRKTEELELQDHVVFLGNRHDVPALMHRAHIFVLPSVQDNQPFAVMEAQLAGMPVVVTDAGGVPEMVTHLVTGLIAPAANAQVLYEHLRTLLDEPALCEQLGRQAQEWAREYWSLSEMTKRMLHTYSHVLEKYRVHAVNRAKKQKRRTRKWRVVRRKIGSKKQIKRKLRSAKKR